MIFRARASRLTKTRRPGTKAGLGKTAMQPASPPLHPAAAAGSQTTSDGAERSALDLAMDRYAQGDDAAFGELFAGLSGRIRLFLRRLGASPELAEDITQETFLKIHQARGNFATGRGVLPWAYAIARNCYIGHARAPKNRLERTSPETEQPEQAAGLDSNAEATTIAKQSARVLEQALQGLTPARREAFVLLRYEGLSVSQAARVLGTSEGAVKVRAFHAYEHLRAALATADGGGSEDVGRRGQ
jgi:RNA polymerase sigma-70 factor (ECF subfamily)